MNDHLSRIAAGMMPMSHTFVSTETTETKQPTVTQKAVELLNANPDWRNKTVRELEVMTGISKATWSRVKAL